ncbi:MAG: GNAT family N-acetyltransferase [Nitrospirae bacterium RBG_13_43_8]|nr:MAG: GNAT family N-acetyltransferase [Nitrospirae bacterium RBG_13_43_8]
MNSLVIIREIKESDAEEFLNLCKRIDAETPYMMFEPGERPTTIEDQRDEIRDILSRDNQTIFIAGKDNQLIGYLAAYGGRYRRNRQTVYIVAGILQGFTSQGVGTRLFEQLEEWAKKRKIHRLDLAVMVHNEAALALYRKIGFEIEGRKKHSLFINDSYVDEYWMSKLLT